eukprot:CAMPEP_0172678906 /NCGR_PEP_ID=MMETSP1074-20121228/15709_1 /TAXON_ID=2916 /ORGANISM="Ceratium fusus, Strain PA161109" /LENGTH=323 /DNA_ID=CAMNT_0013497009 /DNA_START=50 /DNA_END=1021 /DNA_ORIENTATION=-
MTGIQVSLMAALSPEPAKVAALEPTESPRPTAVMTAAASLPGMGAKGLQASSWDGRQPQKVDAMATSSSEEAFAAVAAKQPRKVEFLPPGLPIGVCERSYARNQTIAHLGLATPKSVMGTDFEVRLSTYPMGGAAMRLCGSEGGDTTATCSATDCSSPDRLSAACSRSSSDQDQDFASAVGCDTLLQHSPQVSAGMMPAAKVSRPMTPQDATRANLLATEVALGPNLDQSQVLNTQQWQAAWPSRGSMLHMSGMCQPCAWFWKPVGCQSSSECNFCHICPEGVLKARKKTKQAMKRMGLATPKAGSADPQKEARHALSLASLI